MKSARQSATVNARLVSFTSKAARSSVAALGFDRIARKNAFRVGVCPENTSNGQLPIFGVSSSCERASTQLQLLSLVCWIPSFDFHWGTGAPTQRFESFTSPDLGHSIAAKVSENTMTSNHLIPSCGQQKPYTIVGDAANTIVAPSFGTADEPSLKGNDISIKAIGFKTVWKEEFRPQRHLNPFESFWILLDPFGTNSLLTLRLQLKPNEERQTRIRQDICSLSKKRETGPVHNLDVSIASTPVVLTSSWWACSRRPSSKGGLSQRHWILIGYQHLSDWILLGTAWNSFASLCSFGQGWQRMASDPQILKALDPIWSHRCTLSQNTLNNLNTLRHISTYFDIFRDHKFNEAATADRIHNDSGHQGPHNVARASDKRSRNAAWHRETSFVNVSAPPVGDIGMLRAGCFLTWSIPNLDM